MSTEQDFRDQQLMDIARAIATRGIATIHVGYGDCAAPNCPCQGQREEHPWSYSIGMVELGHPEFVLFGLSPRAAAGRFQWLHHKVAAGRPLVPGAVARFSKLRVRLDPVPTSWLQSEHDPFGQWFHHYEAGRASLQPPDILQLVWADWRNILPDEPGCDPEVVRRQPLLGEPS